MRAPVVRPVIGWCLLAVVVASAWALLGPVEPRATVQAVAGGANRTVVSSAAEGLSTGERNTSNVTMQAITIQDFEPAIRDPFVPLAARKQPLPRAVAVIAAPPSSPAPPPPVMQPPPVQLPVPRYLGQLRTPQGELLVLLVDGESTAPAQPGNRLPSGWEVAAIEPGRVRLVMPGTTSSATVELPPRSETLR